MTSVDRLIEKFDELNIDAAILFDETNQYYFSKYRFSDGALLITRKTNYLITDFRYTEDAISKVKEGFEIVAPKSQLEFICDALKNENIKSLGFEDDTLSYEKYKRLSEKFAIDMHGIGTAISEFRTVKDEREIGKIAKAQEITDKTFSHVLNIITPNITETELALEMEFFMRKNGAEGIAFDTIAVSGSASSLPHGVPRNIPLQKGFLTLDFGAKVEGYCSDMTRTVSIGKATSEMKKIYETVLKAQSLGLERIKEGELCSDLDKTARDYIYNSGYEGCFGHSLGHGVGLYIHESPRLSMSYNVPLKAGNIVTVEPGIYVSGNCGCRIEDMVLVTKDSYMNFTKSKKELIELF